MVSTAAEPVGRLTMLHLNLRASELASLEALPSRRTVAPTKTLWAVPALATGAALLILATTEALAAVLEFLPSLTTKVAL